MPHSRSRILFVLCLGVLIAQPDTSVVNPAPMAAGMACMAAGLLGMALVGRRRRRGRRSSPRSWSEPASG